MDAVTVLRENIILGRGALLEVRSVQLWLHTHSNLQMQYIYIYI